MAMAFISVYLFSDLPGWVKELKGVKGELWLDFRATAVAFKLGFSIQMTYLHQLEWYSTVLLVELFIVNIFVPPGQIK